LFVEPRLCGEWLLVSRRPTSRCCSACTSARSINGANAPPGRIRWPSWRTPLVQGGPFPEADVIKAIGDALRGEVLVRCKKHPMDLRKM
jgi:hypothetical protein